jgi:hypothetical protein
MGSRIVYVEILVIPALLSAVSTAQRCAFLKSPYGNLRERTITLSQTSLGVSLFRKVYASSAITSGSPLQCGSHPSSTGTSFVGVPVGRIRFGTVLLCEQGAWVPKEELQPGYQDRVIDVSIRTLWLRFH